MPEASSHGRGLESSCWAESVTYGIALPTSYPHGAKMFSASQTGRPMGVLIVISLNPDVKGNAVKRVFVGW